MSRERTMPGSGYRHNRQHRGRPAGKMDLFRERPGRTGAHRRGPHGRSCRAEKAGGAGPLTNLMTAVDPSIMLRRQRRPAREGGRS